MDQDTDERQTEIDAAWEDEIGRRLSDVTRDGVELVDAASAALAGAAGSSGVIEILRLGSVDRANATHQASGA